MACYFQKFQKNTPKLHNSIKLGRVSSEILLKSLQVLLFKHHITGKIKVLLHIYMSVFKGRKFEISIIGTYFNIFFQVKTHSKIIIFMILLKFPYFSIQGKICSSKFQIGDSFLHFSQFSHLSYHTQVAIVLALATLISHQCQV